MDDAADHQAAVAARLEDLTGLYERSAYLVYNIALRVACDDAAAQRAASRAVLAQVDHPDPDRLALDAARLGIEEAVPVDPRSVEDPVLSANTRLSSPVRAALALTALAGTPDAAIGETLDLDADAAAELRDRGFGTLGEFLERSQDDAEQAYGDLEWIAPPIELWHALYPELHASVARNVRTVSPDSAAAPPPSAPPPRFSRIRRTPRWAAALAFVLVAGGVALAATGGGSDDDSAEQPAAVDTAADGGSGYQSLTPRELDQLRKRELDDLRRYSREQADKRLSSGERRAAARNAKRVIRLARKRERAAAKRALDTDRQLAAERLARARAQQQAARDRAAAQQRASDPPPTPAPPEQPDDPAPRPPREKKPPDNEDDGGSQGGESTDCVYDAASGTYECGL